MRLNEGPAIRSYQHDCSGYKRKKFTMSGDPDDESHKILVTGGGSRNRQSKAQSVGQYLVRQCSHAIELLTGNLLSGQRWRMHEVCSREKVERSIRFFFPVRPVTKSWKFPAWRRRTRSLKANWQPPSSPAIIFGSAVM